MRRQLRTQELKALYLGLKVLGEQLSRRCLQGKMLHDNWQHPLIHGWMEEYRHVFKSQTQHAHLSKEAAPAHATGCGVGWSPTYRRCGVRVVHTTG
jgi:hypothetical protein